MCVGEDRDVVQMIRHCEALYSVFMPLQCQAECASSCK